MPFIDLKKENEPMKSELENAVLNVVNSGHYILSEEVKKFEKQFSSFIGVKYASAVSSGTSAIHLSLAALGVKNNDEVITVPNTAVPTALAISHAGAAPRFVDVGEDSFLMNPKLLEQTITKKTKAIVPVHLFGQCCEMNEIMEIAEKHSIPVVEDACQAHGAEFNAKKAGSFGKIGCFSFYPTKPLGCFGDGGMITTNDSELAEKISVMKNLGQVNRYEHDLVGFNSRMDDIQAAVLNVKLKHLSETHKKRKRLAMLYSEYLKENESIVTPKEFLQHESAWHLYVVRNKNRDELMEHLSSKEIQTLIHYPIPVHLQRAYSYLGFGEGSFPVSEKLSKEILSLPFYSAMSVSDVERVCKTINDFSK